MIRSFTVSDTDDLIAVWYRASVIAHPFLSESFLDVERVLLVEQWLPLTETSVYEVDGRVVGFISMLGNEVGGFFVDPDHQGKGYGRALMDHARKTRPFLELDVFEANSIGRRFYDTYGFQSVERHLHEETGQPQLRLRMG